ncbi:Inositol triphosphate 3-kinase c [Operophtera brumata]|uniref:Inositol triphosphate 3-kinase c n=1 Tax=Operophtera brumata TaxID=104452 RepID=A0A0L7LJ08_OPEBR|nr:Inositol triphosphate 3-kinase c [Operophtera brumata]
MGEAERRGAEIKRAQPPPAVHTQLSIDDGHEVEILPLHNQAWASRSGAALNLSARSCLPRCTPSSP